MAVFKSENIIAYGFLVLHLTRAIKDADSHTDAVKGQIVLFAMARVLATLINKIQSRLDATDDDDDHAD